MKAFLAEPFIGNFARLSVDTFVGDLLEPLPGLSIDIGKIGERA